MPYKDVEKRRAVKRRWRKAHPTSPAENQRWRKQKTTSQRRKLPTPTRPEPVICECCGRPPKGKIGLHLDHDHTTGKFRGWLCNRCNLGLGLLGDSRDGVERALAYLELLA